MCQTFGKRMLSALVLSVLVVAVVQLRSGIVAQEKVGNGEPLLILYSGPDFSGRSLEVHDTLVDLTVIDNPDGTKFDWNDEIRSIEVVSGTWRLY